MFTRRVLLSALLATGLVAGGVAVAKTHHHHDAHALLGAKLHENGKHQVHQIGSNPVTAEVSNNKVVNMTAGNLPLQKVRSKTKMASLQPEIIRAAANGEFELAQTVAYYYGYCFDTGDALECYWYPAADVVITDSWVDYIPS